jgi:hypothetical protein
MYLLYAFPLSSPHTYDFVVLTSVTHPRKILLVVLLTTHPQLCSLLNARRLSFLAVFLEVRKEEVVRRGQIR